MSLEPIEQVQARYTRQWIALEGVTGTAIGLHEGLPCIQVYITQHSSALSKAIPSEVDGYRVVFKESGHPRAL